MSEIQIGEFVLVAIREACKIVAWANGQELVINSAFDNPFDVICWIQSVDVRELGQGETGITFFDYRLKGEKGQKSGDRRDVTVNFRIENKDSKPFFVEVRLIQEERGLWVAYKFVSGVSKGRSNWNQSHSADGFVGFNPEHHTLINRYQYQRGAGPSPYFSFPYRDLPALEP
jgi:hypothetical protein